MVRALSGDDAGASGKMGMRPPGREPAIIMVWSSREQKSRRINLSGLQMPNISFAWVKQRSPWRRGQIICSSRGALCWSDVLEGWREEASPLRVYSDHVRRPIYDSMEPRRQARLILYNFARDSGRRDAIRREVYEATILFSILAVLFVSSRVSGSLDDFLARMFAKPEPPHRSVAFHANSRTEMCLTIARRWQVSYKYRLF